MKVEISNGDLVDKVTILAIKLLRIEDEDKLKNIKKEHDSLANLLMDIEIDEHSYLYRELWHINMKLWDIEDGIREKERKREFDDEFVSLARKVYITNDKRCEIKKQINIETGSNLVEEKSYEEY
jgi:hypothetical protein